MFSFNVRETFKTNGGIWKETTESTPAPQFNIMSGAVASNSASAWSWGPVKAVVGSNPSVAASKLGVLGKFVYHTLPVFEMRHNKLLVPSTWCLWRGKYKTVCTKDRFSQRDFLDQVLLFRISSGLARFICRTI